MRTDRVNGNRAFFKDIKTQDVVIRNLEIIGDAVKHLSSKLKRAHEDIPWKLIAGSVTDRFTTIYYFGIDVVACRGR